MVFTSTDMLLGDQSGSSGSTSARTARRAVLVSDRFAGLKSAGSLTA